MNREIKFRLWLKEYNQLIYPHLCDFIKGGEGNIIGQIIPHFKYGKGLCFDALFVNSNFSKDQLGTVNDYFDDIEYVVQQFTGLFDKNGKDIYEGDIVIYRNKLREVRFGNFWNGEDDYNGFFIQDHIIKHRNFGTSKLYAFGYSEVVGNIFQNPELNC